MLQYDRFAGRITCVPAIEQVLDDHASQLGHDFTAYRNHVYRVVNFSVALQGDGPLELEKIAIAAVFHDLGIWTNQTFDYIAPSAALARDYLSTRGMVDWIPEIDAMIMDHHKITSAQANPHSLIESFRRADWIDVSLGVRTFGLPRAFVSAVRAAWPNAGFHRRLVHLTIDRLVKHPLTPLPMVRW